MLWYVGRAPVIFKGDPVESIILTFLTKIQNLKFRFFLFCCVFWGSAHGFRSKDAQQRHWTRTNTPEGRTELATVQFDFWLLSVVYFVRWEVAVTIDTKYGKVNVWIVWLQLFVPRLTSRFVVLGSNCLGNLLKTNEYSKFDLWILVKNVKIMEHMRLHRVAFKWPGPYSISSPHLNSFAFVSLCWFQT